MNKFRLNNQLSLINEEEEEDINSTQTITKIDSSPDMKQKGIEQQTNSSKSTGLDRFMNFLDQPKVNSLKKLKHPPKAKETKNVDELNP
jgi:hypothetical protein